MSATKDMTLRSLTESEVEFVIRCESEDRAVRGNFMSGDDAMDKSIEDDIIGRLDTGDAWAWCVVKVEARWCNFVGANYLGGCSYADQDDFVYNSRYYDDMKDAALRDLNLAIARTFNKLKPLIEIEQG
jgi:hypothetical protein